MTVAVLLAALLAAPGLLDDAREAFATGDYERAERLALEAAEPPDAAAALYLAGLARFRAGRFAEALEAIDRAGPGADAPAAFHHNRAACLHELGRWAEAEAEDLRAADEDAALAPVALVGAGWAALEAGAVDRARDHAVRARGVASGAELELVAELDASVGAAAFAPPERPVVPPPGAPGPPLPAPASAALDRKPWAALARIETGWDSNALQTGLLATGERPGVTAAGTASPVTATRLALSARPALGDRARADLGYALDQLAYTALDARDRSVQQHVVVGQLELDLGDRVRLGGAVEGDLAFAGLSAFRAMSGAAGARLWTALAEGDRSATRLELSWLHQEALADEFSYLAGERLDAALVQELRLGKLGLSGGVRVLHDGLGDAAEGARLVPPSPLCPEGCTAETIRALGWDGATAWLAGRIAPLAWLSLELSVGGEWRAYRGDDRVELASSAGAVSTVDLGSREERRLLTAALASVRLSSRVSLLLRHELLVNRSTAQPAGAALPVGGCRMADPQCGRTSSGSPGSYDKQVFTVGGLVAW